MIIESKKFLTLWSKLAGFKVAGVNLLFIIIVKDRTDEVLVNHERIHARQAREMLYIGFLLWYGIEYLVHRCKGNDHQKAYQNIKFEKEAYLNENIKEYLQHRPAYAWVRY